MLPHPVNILDTYLKATPGQIAEGMAWYPHTQSVATILDPDFTERAAGVIAALSPRNGWKKNVNDAATVFAGEIPHGMGQFVNKAMRIYDGENPLDVLGEFKSKHFYLSILYPESDAVAVDRHAFDIAVGMETDDRIRSNTLKRKGMYDLFADTYRNVADMVGISAPSLQAITWVTWRDLKGVSHYG